MKFWWSIFFVNYRREVEFYIYFRLFISLLKMSAKIVIIKVSKKKNIKHRWNRKS